MKSGSGWQERNRDSHARQRDRQDSSSCQGSLPTSSAVFLYFSEGLSGGGVALSLS